MKKFSILLSLISFSLWNCAQEVLFEDTFDEKNDTWTSVNNHADEEFKDGNLILLGYLRKETVLVAKDIILNPLKDFTISCNIKYDHGRTKGSYGMVLLSRRTADKTKLFFFMLYPQNYYQISYSNTSNLKFYDYLPKQKSTGIIRPSGEYNKLEIRNSDNTFEYLINDQRVLCKEDSDICVAGIGFFCMGLQEVRVDYFVVKQNGWHQINLVDDSLTIYEKENLGENVNSAVDELSPIISADGQTLYICVAGDEENVGIDNQQDIWYSTLNPDNTWSKRVNIGFPLNNEGPNHVFYISPDNNTLIVGNRYDKSGNLIGEGISISNLQKNGWSLPEALNINNFYNKQNEYSVTYSPSGKMLIISLERNDTFGDQDLYVSFKRENGSWSEPQNMGSDINTFGGEITPFLAADNTTLYYATNARPGYGNYDIFLTRRLDDTWTKWTEPENLGPNINTPGWDAYFTIPASGEYSYLVSTDNSFGMEDIFRVKVSKAARPNPVVLIKGKVFNIKSSEFLEANITYFDLETNQEIGLARSNPINGTYQISLPGGHKYSYYAQKEGYFSVSENIDLLNLDAYSEISRDLYLAPMEVGQSIRLNNIFFEFDKSNLLEESIFELERLVTIMNENRNMVIQIAGHTDNYGSDAYNKKLSEDRAMAVYMYLKSKGLGDRASSVGYGESMPVSTNDTDEGRALNRRVEFVILSK